MALQWFRSARGPAEAELSAEAPALLGDSSEAEAGRNPAGRPGRWRSAALVVLSVAAAALLLLPRAGRTTAREDTLQGKELMEKVEVAATEAPSLTMSFDVAGVSYDALIGKCRCLDKFVAALTESIAFAATVGTEAKQVSVSVQRAASFDVPLPALPDDAVLELHKMFKDPMVLEPAAPTFMQAWLAKKQQEWLKRVEEWEQEEQAEEDQQPEVLAPIPNATAPIPNATVLPGELAAEAEEAEEQADEEAAAPNATEQEAGTAVEAMVVTGSAPAVVRKLQARPSYVDAVKKAAMRVSPGFAGIGVDAISVQVTLQCGDNCADDKAKLLSGMPAILVPRIMGVLAGKAAVGPVEIRELVVPAAATTCAQVECSADAYLVNRNPLKKCIGAACEEQCCQPRTCAEVSCSGGLLPVQGAAKGQTCTSAKDCADKCCLQKCSSVKCVGDSVCKKKGAWMLKAKPSEAQDVCCETQDPKCCHSPIAWCAACLSCQSMDAYCHSKVKQYAPGALAALKGGRRLDGAESTALPWTSNDHSGGLVATVAPRGASAEELARARAETAGAVAEAVGAGAPRLVVSRAQAYKRRLQEKKASAKVLLLKGAADQLQKAEDWLKRYEPKKQVGVTPRVPSDAEKARIANRTMAWNKVLDSIEGQPKGLVHGCQVAVGVAQCQDYYLKSMFLLHRGFGPKAKAVNTVQVLTDTCHAVTCGQDGVCWVWDISSGWPRTVFVPDGFEYGKAAPVTSVSVLYDATYILSGGPKDAKDPSKGGIGYLWTWRHAFLEKTIKTDGVVLSSAVMAAWRQVLVGDSEGYTTVWEWANNVKFPVPYHAHTAQYWKERISTNLKHYFENNIDGWDRLIIVKKLYAVTDFIQYINETHPDIAKKAGIFETIFDWKHANRMGPVNGIAYTPTRILFVTVHGDGRVRLWDGLSGTLLLVMKGHQGSVNAVAPFPNVLQVATGGSDGTVRIWDLASGRQLMLFNQAYGGPVLSVAVKPGGHKVMVGSADGYVRIWDVDSGLLECAINTGGGAVKGLAINPSAPVGQIITANADGYARVYNP